MRAAFHVGAVVCVALALVACVTDNNTYVVYEPGTDQRAKAKPAAKSEPKTAAKQPSAASAKAALSDSVRADLRGNCLMEYGGLFGGGEKVTKQCDCYASGIIKTMSKDDLDLYAQYKVLSTLSVAKPEDVKKQCGFQYIPSTRGQRVPGT
jgi:hypothetical protein